MLIIIHNQLSFLNVHLIYHLFIYLSFIFIVLIQIFLIIIIILLSQLNLIYNLGNHINLIILEYSILLLFIKVFIKLQIIFFHKFINLLRILQEKFLKNYLITRELKFTFISYHFHFTNVLIIIIIIFHLILIFFIISLFLHLNYYHINFLIPQPFNYICLPLLFYHQKTFIQFLLFLIHTFILIK